ncbi:MAG: S8 family serine peptidase, partial [Bacteroidetes bacterium]|nr:S8 family serine peptidase [Bacteroidota bacterium]
MKIKQQIIRLFPLLLLMAICLGAGISNQLIAQKTKITSADQLPRRTYQVEETDFLQALENVDLIESLAKKLESNLKADLNQFEIVDPATLKGYYSTLQSLAIRKNDFKNARKYSDLTKPLNDKEVEKLIHGIGLNAYQHAFEVAGQDTGATFRETYRKHLYAQYAQLPYPKIEEHVLSQKASLELSSRDLIVGSIKAQIQPVIEKIGNNWPESLVAALISYEQLLHKSIYLLDEKLTVFTQLVEENQGTQTEKVDIWAKRQIDFPETATSQLKPVLIGIWDTGVDMEVFDRQNRFINEAELLDGKDNDGNGFIDDRYGIAFNANSENSPYTLLPGSDLIYKKSQLEALSSGFYDLQANIQSEEADQFKAFMRTLKQEDMQAFFENMSWYGVYAHGTHVAGIAQQGNSAAKIMAA